MKLSGTQSWMVNSSPLVLAQVNNLDASYDGIREYLNQFPSEMDGVKVLRLLSIQTAPYALVQIAFAIERANGTKGTYEYCLWKGGQNAGAKGIVFVENERGIITHFVLMETLKFAVARKVLEAVGGFGADAIIREVVEEVGATIESITARELGCILPDPGMTANRVAIFAAFVKTLPDPSHMNTDAEELASNVRIFPIGDFARIIRDSEDGMLKAIAFECIVQCIVKL